MKSNAARSWTAGASASGSAMVTSGSEPQAAHHAGGPVHLDLLAVAQRVQQAREPHHARDPHLARHDGRVAEEAAALNQQSLHGGEEQHPARVGALGNQDMTLERPRGARIAYDPHQGANHAGTAAGAAELG